MKTNLTRQELFHEARTAINSSDRDADTKKKMTDGLESLAYPLFDGAEMYSFDSSDLERVGVTLPKTRSTRYLCWKDDDKGTGWEYELAGPVQTHGGGDWIVWIARR